MPNNPLTQAELTAYTSNTLYPQIPAGYFFASPPTGAGPLAYRLFDASYISIGIINPNRLGTGSTGAGNLYLADDGTWKSITVATPTLAQVTTAGNTTTNSITVGGLVAATNLIYTDTVNSRVGIGTTSPTRTLTVNGPIIIPNNSGYYTKTTGGSELSVFIADTSNNVQIGSIFFGGGQINYTSTLFDWYNYPSSVLTHRMRLTASGNLLIGTTTDSGYRLNVNGTTRFIGDSYVSSGDLLLDNDRPIRWKDSGGTFRRAMLITAANDFQFGPVDTGWAGQTYLKAGGGIYFLVNGSSGTSIYAGGFSSAGNFIVDTDTLFVDATNNRVGVGTTSPNYKVDVQGTTLANSSVSVQGAFNINPLAAPPAISSYTLSAGTNLGVGTYYYFVVYVTALGETSAGANLTVVTTTGNTTVNLTGIPVSSDPRVTARKIYRTKVGGTGDNQWFLATISDNVTTTYTDSTADTSLTGANLQAYKVNTTARNFTVSGVQGMVIDNNLTALGRSAGNAIITSNGAAVRTVLIGAYAGQNITTGTSNVIVGQAGGYITTGNSNSLFGDLAGWVLVGGSHNTIMGNQAGRFLTSGFSNTILGTSAGRYLYDGTTQFTTGYNNVFVGGEIRVLTANDNNSIVIGYDGRGLGSNTTVIGNSSTTFTSIPAGNLAVGTTTNAGFRLDVNGTARVSGILSVSSATGGYVYLQDTSALAAINVISMQNVGANYAILSRTSTGGYVADHYGIVVTSGSNSYQRWFTSGSERIRLVSSGNLLINTTTDAGFRLDVNGTARVQGAITSTALTTDGPVVSTSGVLGSVAGYTGMVTIQQPVPLPPVTFDIQNGIIVNVL